MKGKEADAVTPVDQVELFDSAFDAASADKPEEKPPEPAVPVAAQKNEPVAAGENPDPPSGEKPAEPKEPKGTPDGGTPPDEEKTYEQRYKSLQGIYKSEKETWRKREAELIAQAEKPAAPPAPEPQKKEKEPVTLTDFRASLTDEQKAELDEYERDFDVISKMEGLKRAKELAALEERMKAYYDRVISEKMAPADTLIQEVRAEREVRSQEEHFGAIAKAHPDFEEHRDSGALLTWIDSKPKYMKRGLMEIYQNGEAEDVIALIGDFKKDNNLIPAEPPSDVEQVIDLNEKREQKRQALKSVTSRRSAVNPAMNVREDFEGAFEEATTKQ